MSDITYLPLANGDWAYLCAFQDMASKHVVGSSATMPEELVTTALQRAFFAQPPTPECSSHSDRGGQYCGNAYRALLRPRGRALAEPPRRVLWSRLKTEVLELREWPVFTDLADAQASVADYFDYYNHERLHSNINNNKIHNPH